MAGCADQVKRVTLEAGRQERQHRVRRRRSRGCGGGRSPAGCSTTRDRTAAPAAAFSSSAPSSTVPRVVRRRGRAVEGRRSDGRVDSRWVQLVTAQHLRKVRSFSDSLETVFTGTAPSSPGFWHPIMIATPTDPSASVCRDEIFGPVAGGVAVRGRGRCGPHLQRQRTTGCPARCGPATGAKALRVCVRWRPGRSASTRTARFDTAPPFGGFKQSGLGREHSMHVLDHYTELKNVFIAT
jgi:acyl-CoA reductase-like NAD-dependent aldehyde dehydrogenase